MTSVDFSEVGPAQVGSIQMYEADVTVPSTKKKTINEFWLLEKTNCPKRKRFIASDRMNGQRYPLSLQMFILIRDC